eukprot:1534475-Amphidinium_carterae.1
MTVSSVSSITSATSSTSSDRTEPGETSHSTVSTSSSTTTSLTLGIVQGETTFAADGVTAAEVREACVIAVADATEVEREHIQCTVEYPSSSRRLLTVPAGSRRLTSTFLETQVWRVTFTIEVPNTQIPEVELSLDMIETNEQNKTY